MFVNEVGSRILPTTPYCDTTTPTVAPLKTSWPNRLEMFNEAIREKSGSQHRFTAPTPATTLLGEPR